jgi:Zn-dependent peptidase ImmA (M78 family)
MQAGFDINKQIYTWAIGRAGFNVENFIIKNPKIQDWINDVKQPTLKQLEDFSRKVHLPFGYLFLPNIPNETLTFPFFRTTNSKTQQVSLNVYDTILNIQSRQDWIRSYFIDNEFEEKLFVGKFSITDNVNDIVDSLRLHLDLKNDWASNFYKWEDAIDFLTTRIEDLGIFVTFNGIVENNTSRPIPVSECRGFVLVDKHAPFMFINNADSKSAQIFTLIHELAHIWIGQSAGFDIDKLLPANDPVELICDNIAAEFLVPANSLLLNWTTSDNISNLSKKFKVSQIVIARRALDLNLITKKKFFEIYNYQVVDDIKRRKEKASGGNFYDTAKKRIGLAFASHIFNAVNSGELMYRDAYKLTNLKGDTFETFMNKYIRA